MLKTLQLVGALLLAGGPVFLTAIWRPALAASPPEQRADLGGALARWLRLGADIGLGLLVLGGAVDILFLASALAGSPIFSAATAAQVITVSLHTDRGRLVALRAALATVLWVAARAIAAQRDTGAQRPVGPWHVTAAAAAIGVFLSFSLGGHAATVARDRVAAVAADLVHFLTAASWGGGIWYFAVLPWPRLRTEEGLPVVREIVRRFTILGLTAVALIVTTGLFMSTQYLWGLPALFETRYGRDLLWKHALIVLILAAAMDNRYNLRLRLFGRTGAGPAFADRLVRSLRGNVWVEAVAILMVVTLAGFLTSASAETRRPQVVTVIIQDFSYQPRTMVIPRQRPVRLVLDNRDRVTHSLAVRRFPYEGPAAHVHDPAAAQTSDLVVYVPPRSKQSVVFVALEFGTYQVADVLEDYEDRGMTGTLVVK